MDSGTRYGLDPDLDGKGARIDGMPTCPMPELLPRGREIERPAEELTAANPLTEPPRVPDPPPPLVADPPPPPRVADPPPPRVADPPPPRATPPGAALRAAIPLDWAALSVALRAAGLPAGLLREPLWPIAKDGKVMMTRHATRAENIEVRMERFLFPLLFNLQR